MLPADISLSADTATRAGRVPIERLTRRSDFQRVSKGRRWQGKAFTLQMNASMDTHALRAEVSAPRVGLTLTRKVGCAVIRNRARRRMREAIRIAPDLPLRPGHDYVLIGRLEAVRVRFEELARELNRAIVAVHEMRAARPGDRTGPRKTRLKP